MTANGGDKSSGDLRDIFLSGAPLLDVRAPVEFNKGAFPGAVNHPLLNDAERQKVGTCYKHHGQQAAIDLGHQLVSGHIKEERVAAWADFARAHPGGYLYCFRGGLRSKISQQWLAEAGYEFPRIDGGYKAMRTFLMDTTEAAATQCRLMVVGGLTGTGKTEVLAQVDSAIDLESHAHHRGSSFGKHATPQPSQIDFENRLAIDILRRRAAGYSRLAVEDESRAIGRCAVPLLFHNAMGSSPLVWLEDSLEGRTERILKDYVIDLRAEFVALNGDEERGFDAFAVRLRESLDNIVRRLGGERHRRLAAIMDEALAAQRHSGDLDRHRNWIRGLLEDYYDPMYAYQKEKKAGRIVFAGNSAEVAAFLRECSGTPE